MQSRPAKFDAITLLVGLFGLGMLVTATVQMTMG